MLILSRDVVAGKARTVDGKEMIRCPFCEADELAVFRRNFQARSIVPDCSHCPLLSHRGVDREHLWEDCSTVGKIILHLFESYFERGDSAW